MAIYIQQAGASDLSPSWTYTSVFDNEMTDTTGTDTGIVVTIPSGASFRSASFITNLRTPNNNDWGSGEFSVELQVDSANANIGARCRPVRLSFNTGTILESGQWGVQKQLTGSVVFDSGDLNAPEAPVSGWTTGDYSNRLAIEFEFEKIGGTGDQSVTIGVGTTANEVDSPIAEDTQKKKYIII